MPELPREGATNEKVVDALGLLVAEEAKRRVWKDVFGKALDGPAMVEQGKPNEDHGLPSDPPVRVLNEAMEHGRVAGHGRVGAKLRPSPSKPIGGGGESDIM